MEKMNKMFSIKGLNMSRTFEFWNLGFFPDYFSIVSKLYEFIYWSGATSATLLTSNY